MELFSKLRALPVDQKRQLLHGLVDGDIVVTPLGPLDVSDPDDVNILNGWAKIQWEYNPAIIQEVLGVIIPNVDKTPQAPSGTASLTGKPGAGKTFRAISSHVQPVVACDRDQAAIQPPST